MNDETKGARLIVKLCGVTTVTDAVAAADAGADWIGVNFWPSSPRAVTPSLAREIVQRLPAEVQAVGVFVNQDPQQIQRVVDRVGLHRVQLHGDEPPSALSAVDVPTFKAFRVGGPEDLDGLAEYLQGSSGTFLVDARHPTLVGGSGLRVGLKLAIAANRLGKMILAGGLTPGNVAEHVRAVQPAGVDVASGVETSPGHKSHAAMRAFVRNARQAFRPSGHD